MEYGIAALGTASKTNFQKIERVQNHSLRIMTGGIKSTPINSMESVRGLESLADRRKKKIVCQYTKFQHLANHPMCKLITNNPRKRLKRTNFTASAQQIHKSLELPDLRPDTPLQSSIDWPPWNQQSQIEIVKDIDGVTSKKSMIKRELHCLTQNMLDKKYPSNYWIRAFTDGSASEAHNSKDAIHKLSRAAQVTIFRLRTGHNRLKHHLFSRFKIGDGPNCPCGANRQDAQHVLQDCPLLDDARLKYWPEPREMNQKLYGSAPQLGITAEFICASDLTI
ncbi:phosphotransferase [Elysia marginata]|uniref:Phosphotransferase n=1 Tax=Elysia marginata TaxID=1093978 RepID=A0AAV4HM20_9GAST|nr:phosphotransferase [Elysia marginata]